MVAKEQEYFLNNIKAAIGLEREAETQKEIIETYLQQSNKIKPQLVTEPLPKEPEKPVYAPQKKLLSADSWYNHVHFGVNMLASKCQ